MTRDPTDDRADPDLSTMAATAAVVTYRRPELLAGALASLLEQAIPVGIDLGVVVVDNDPDGSAKGVVDRLADDQVRYVHEPQPGLAAGRNAALDAASGSRLFVFLDDDNRPRAGWLLALYAAWATWGADAVTGPVAHDVPLEAEPWVLASGFFGHTHRASGDRAMGAASCNLLLDFDTVRRLGLRFDDRFGLSGGEDTMFTRSLTAGGGEIRWCDEAVIDDPVPPDRLTRSWVLQTRAAERKHVEPGPHRPDEQLAGWADVGGRRVEQRRHALAM